MTPWDSTPMNTLVYVTLMGSSRDAGKMVRHPKRGVYLTMRELVGLYMRHGQTLFEKKYPESPIVESEWFLDFVKRDHTIEKIVAYLRDRKQTEQGRKVFLAGLIGGLREFSALDTRVIILPDEKQIEKYFYYLIDVAKAVLKLARGAVAPGKLQIEASQTEANQTEASQTEASQTRGNQPAESSAQLRERYLSMLQSQKQYCELVETFLELGGREDWTRIDLCEYPTEMLADHGEFWLMMRDFLYAPGAKSMREWLAGLRGAMWEPESVYALTTWYRGQDAKTVPESVKECMVQYYNNRIAGAEFRIRSLGDWQDGPNRQGMQVDMLLYFAERFGLEIPKDQRLNLLMVCPYPPREGTRWLPELCLSENEIRQGVIWNVQHGIVNDVVFRWHVRYCIDHDVEECRESLMKVARSHPRRMQLRMAAMEYTCKYMKRETIKRELLPYLQGELFFYAASQILEPGDEELADIIWKYGVHFAANKMHADVLLVFLQSRRGVESFLWHTEKRHQLPPESREFGIIDAVRAMSSPKLLGEMERLFTICLRDSFRDDPRFSLRAAIGEALSRMAVEQPEQREKVQAIFMKAMERDGAVPWKREYIQQCMERASCC